MSEQRVLVCKSEQECTQMPWCRIEGHCRNAVGAAVLAGVAPPNPNAPSLVAINELAKAYASNYASPHHITFTVEGLRNLMSALGVAPSQAPVKRWPFVESPGEFTERLRAALGHFDGDLLAAVRNVLIENPPTPAADAKENLQ